MATKQTPAVATTTQTTEIVDTLNPFRSKIEFETAQRMAALFAQSPMVPDTYKGNIGSCVIALDMANRMGAAPLMVMQNFVSYVMCNGDASKELEQIWLFFDFFKVNSTSVQEICRFYGNVNDDDQDQEGSFLNAIQTAKLNDAAILVTSFRNIPFSIRRAVQGHAIDFKAMSLAGNERGLGIVLASEFYKYD